MCLELTRISSKIVEIGWNKDGSLTFYQVSSSSVQFGCLVMFDSATPWTAEHQGFDILLWKEGPSRSWHLSKNKTRCLVGCKSDRNRRISTSSLVKYLKLKQKVLAFSFIWTPIYKLKMKFYALEDIYLKKERFNISSLRFLPALLFLWFSLTFFLGWRRRSFKTLETGNLWWRNTGKVKKGKFKVLWDRLTSAIASYSLFSSVMLNYLKFSTHPLFLYAVCFLC